MKLTHTKKGYTLTGISSTQFVAALRVLNTANDRCFNEPETTGEYHSNEDFVCTLTGEQREALTSLCRGLSLAIDVLALKSNL